mmetsp:Transcript_19284/g.61371  ORF Transcript_19284/g.61371 Transcript_19284/m.61371 type:complete len:292 (+) Transcript_19284:506-1381(+)
MSLSSHAENTPSADSSGASSARRTSSIAGVAATGGKPSGIRSPGISSPRRIEANEIERVFERGLPLPGAAGAALGPECVFATSALLVAKRTSTTVAPRASAAASTQKRRGVAPSASWGEGGGGGGAASAAGRAAASQIENQSVGGGDGGGAGRGGGGDGGGEGVLQQNLKHAEPSSVAKPSVPACVRARMASCLVDCPSPSMSAAASSVDVRNPSAFRSIASCLSMWPSPDRSILVRNNSSSGHAYFERQEQSHSKWSHKWPPSNRRVPAEPAASVPEDCAASVESIGSEG